MKSAVPALLTGAAIVLVLALGCGLVALWRRQPSVGWAALMLLILGLGLGVLAAFARLS